jgi:hypothetical protein
MDCFIKETRQEAFLNLRGFSVFVPTDCDWKDERHREAMNLVSRWDDLGDRLIAIKQRREEMLRAIASYDDRERKIEDERADIAAKLAEWGY